MTIHYSITERERYLYLAGEGVEDGLEENIKIHRMIIDACRDHDCHRVLIDDRNVIYTASALSLYKLAEHYAKVDIPRFIQRAAVVANPKYKADSKFFEDVMRNRGINLRSFYDLDEAQAWLDEV